MTEIIPAILVSSREEFEQRVRAIETLASIAQIDVIDGTWLPSETWADPRDISNIISPLTYELHLMVAHPIEHLDEWTELPSVKRVIFHIETVTQPKQVIEAIRFHGWEVGLAINPETPLSTVHDYIPYVDEVMFMTVKPGAAGRPFERSVLNKIEALRETAEHTLIGVDGAITRETLPLCVGAGATRVRVNSSLFAAPVSVADAWTGLHHVAQHA